MKKCLIIFFIFFINLNAHSSSNQKIINHLKNINSLQFKFIQKIDNNNIEKVNVYFYTLKKFFVSIMIFITKY